MDINIKQESCLTKIFENLKVNDRNLCNAASELKLDKVRGAFHPKENWDISLLTNFTMGWTLSENTVFSWAHQQRKEIQISNLQLTY